MHHKWENYSKMPHPGPSLAPPLTHENNYSTQINYCGFMIMFRGECDFQLNVCTKHQLVLVCVSNFHSLTDIFSSLFHYHTQLSEGTLKWTIIWLEYLQEIGTTTDDAVVPVCCYWQVITCLIMSVITHTPDMGLSGTVTSEKPRGADWGRFSSG